MAKPKGYHKFLSLALLVSSVVAHEGRGTGLITRCEAPGTNGYFVSRDKFPYSSAESACHALGGYLADLSDQNFLIASDFVFSCAGPNKLILWSDHGTIIKS
ncbi:uncharacterized protein B0P05DRAFT_564683 [Gilbertella persicaria]|uniref:uncharacterized protein n=1 Tax=Gilbertella persicaria TaxID=101096 RepID=UPI00222001B8|nr:uncharacterized protein B0P05DRAFT_564683 [Gilbertella persicaria]KAI8048145.1 hypothetical protein B0P05DRAFT_564683 [Gilbertella persicaria]